MSDERDHASPQRRRPLRILHCFREPAGGLFRHVRDLAAAQAESGHAVGILCDADTGGPREDALLDALKPKLALGLYRIPMQRHVGIGDAAAALRACRIIRNARPDILHGHGAKGGVHARLFGSLLRLAGARPARIYSPHGGSLHFDGATKRGGAVFLAERLLAPLTDATLFVSNFEKRIYEEKVGRPRGLHAVIHNGLCEADFQPVKTAGDASDFVFVGTMRDLKGPDILLHALRALRESGGETLTATLVGDGPDRPRFIELARELGLADAVRFLPGMAARDAFALGRVTVIPSRAEAFPYIVLEALAAGRTVIASRVGGIPEVFGPASPALFEPEPQALADKIRAIRSRGQPAMPDPSRLRERFDLHTMAHSIETIYREALS